MLLVEYPRFERLPATRTACVGNEAVIRASAGLVALLEAPLSDRSFKIGGGYQAPLTVPFGLAVTAAVGALGETDPHQDRWMVRRAMVDWHARARGDDVITAQAIVERTAEHEAFVGVTANGSESGPLLHAGIRLLAMHGGQYAAIAKSGLAPASAGPSDSLDDVESSSQTVGLGVDTPERTEQPLLSLQPPRVLASGPRPELVFTPDLVRLLMHPVAGNTNPLGRRVHPLGAGPLGAALTTALAAAGEGDPDQPVRTRIQRADATWFLPVSLRTPWIGRTRDDTRDGAGRAVVDVISGKRTALAADIHWTVT